MKHIDSHKEGLNFVLFKQAFDNTVQIFRKYLKNYFSLTDIFNEIPDIQDFFQKQILEYPKYKVNINVQIEYILKGTDNVISEKELFNLRSSNFIISRALSNSSMGRILNEHISEILKKENEMNLAQSGWVSNKLIFIDLKFH